MIGNAISGFIGTPAVSAAKATGGTITSDATHWYHSFTASGTFTPLEALTIDIVVIAGGGGGGVAAGGGGGAGGVLGFASQSVTTTGYTCTVGAGGSSGSTSASNGNDSKFGSLTTCCYCIVYSMQPNYPSHLFHLAHVVAHGLPH